MCSENSEWNAHRILKQKEKELPVGVPEHIYTCPERQWGGGGRDVVLQLQRSS